MLMGYGVGRARKVFELLEDGARSSLRRSLRLQRGYFRRIGPPRWLRWEFKVRLLADDSSCLFVNGMKVLETGKYNEVRQTSLYLRRGDIVTVPVPDLQVGAEDP